MDKDVTIHISAGSVVKTLSIIILFALLFFLRDVIVGLLAAVVIASAVEPAILWLMRLKVPRLVGVILVYATVVLGLLGSFYFILPPLLEDTAKLLTTLPPALDITSITGSAGFFGIRDAVEGLTSGSLTQIISNLSESAASLSGGFWSTALSIFGGALGFIFIIVLSFYLSAQENGVEKFLKLVTPLKNEDYIIDLWKRSQKKIGLWMQGQILLGLLVGIFVYLGLAILEVPNAFLLAFLSGIFEIIPVFGPILGAVPAIAIASLDGGLTLGVLVAGLYIIIQQFENHLIYPLVVKKVVGVPPILVILALIIGFKLSGLLGALLSVPIAAALVEYLGDIEKAKDTLKHKVS